MLKQKVRSFRAFEGKNALPVTIILDALQHDRSRQFGILPYVSKKRPIDGLAGRRVDPARTIMNQFPPDDSPEAGRPSTVNEDDDVGEGNAELKRPLIRSIHDPRIVGNKLPDDGVPLVRRCGDPAWFPEAGIQMNAPDAEHLGQVRAKVRLT